MQLKFNNMPIRRESYCNEGFFTSCVKPPEISNRITFSTKDDFKLVYQFKDTRYQPAILIPLDSFELSIRYFIKGRPESYTVHKGFDTNHNCIIIPDKSVIKAVIDTHGLKSGQLFAEFTFKYPDSEYPDGFGSTVCIEDTGITLIENNF